jgi:hypothetical protein
MARIIPCLLLALLAGCVDLLAQREARLKQLVGAPEAVLVQQMGVPNRSIETGGVKYFAYEDKHLDIIPASPPIYGPWWYGAYGGGFPPDIIERSCETTFQVVDGVVRGFTLRGNACG